MTRRTEFWWVEWCEGMPPEPARIGFEGDVPATIEEIGGYTQPLADRDVRLIERVLPAGRVGVAVANLEEALAERCYPECCAMDGEGRKILKGALAILQVGALDRIGPAVAKLEEAFHTRCGDDIYGIVEDAIAILQREQRS